MVQKLAQPQTESQEIAELRNALLCLVEVADASQLSVLLNLAHKLGLGNAHLPKPTRPTVAPEEWKPRGGERKETIIAFLRRVYGPYLDGSFTRADLGRLDPKAYQALQNWLRSNSLPADVTLPTKSEYNDRLLGGLSLNDERVLRALEARRRRPKP